MKYVIHRRFAFRNFKYEIDQSCRTVYKAKAKRSKEVEGQYTVVIYDAIGRFSFGQSAFTEVDPTTAHTYRIFIKNNKTDEKTFFGYLQYQRRIDRNSIYRISVQNKLYDFQSEDLRKRRLALIDMFGAAESTSSPIGACPMSLCPNTLFQVTDSFSETNESYQVTIDNQENQLGYLVLVILLDLLECRRR